MAAETEVSLVAVVGAIGLEGGRSDGERVSAWVAAFVLCVRNGAATVEAAGKLLVGGVGPVMQSAYSNQLKGKDGFAVVAAFARLYNVHLMYATHTRFESGDAGRQSAVQSGFAFLKSMTQLSCTPDTCEDSLKHLLELTADDDEILAAGAAEAAPWPLLCAAGTFVSILARSREAPAAMLALCRRLKVVGKPASWWKELSARGVSFTSSLAQGPWAALHNIAGATSKLPFDNADWNALINESIHLMKVNHEMELSAKTHMIWCPFGGAGRIICLAVREPLQHERLLQAGVVQALLWTTAHDFLCFGVSISHSAAIASVALIGRNEGGLTLTRESVNTILDEVHHFWAGASTSYRAKMAMKAPVKKLLGRVLPVADVVIADANKPFVLQHKTALDDLVHGLLVDTSHPRRKQEGADTLQQTCALVLQNLALSDVGRDALRSHSGVMAALRSIASGGGGARKTSTSLCRGCAVRAGRGGAGKGEEGCSGVLRGHHGERWGIDRARDAVVQLGSPGRGQAHQQCAEGTGLRCVDRHREDAGIDGRSHGRSGGAGGVCGVRNLTSVQGVGELSAGGAVRVSATEEHGAADARGWVQSERLAGNVLGCAPVVRVLWGSVI
eukprot:COSAG01_NODE_1735_length_9365_cov_3.816318_10_plen_616_part_00